MITKEQAEALLRPFDASEVEWRVGQAGIDRNGNPWVRALAYLTSRAVMERLDEVFGVGGWSHSLREIALGNAVGVICRLEAGGCAHEDVAECSDIEALKGAASGGLKRAAVAFGIGRYLYFLEDGFAKVHPNGKFRHSGKAKDGKPFECKWDPPPLPAWALPPKGSKPLNPYAKESNPPPVGDLPGSVDPQGTLPPEAQPTILGLVVPPGTPPEFLTGIEKFFDDPAKVAQKLRSQYALVHKAAAELGIELPPTVDPKAFPVEIANAILQGKAAIDEARQKAKVAA